MKKEELFQEIRNKIFYIRECKNEYEIVSIMDQIELLIKEHTQNRVLDIDDLERVKNFINFIMLEHTYYKVVISVGDNLAIRSIKFKNKDYVKGLLLPHD